MNNNSSPQPDNNWLRFWSHVQFKQKSVERIANKKNLKSFICASQNEIRRTMDPDFRLTTFKFDIGFQSDLFHYYIYLPAPYNETLQIDNRCLSFKDGLYNTPSGKEIMYWTLPWFGYQMSVNSNTNYTTENINSIVENAMILLELNDVHLTDYITTKIYAFDWFGYDSKGLVLYSKYLMVACCFFYEKHKKTSKDAISIDQLMFLCVHNLYERLTSNTNRNTCISTIMEKLKERNVKNYRSRYKQDEDKPVIVTYGKCSRQEKHSISMTKYDKSVDKKIEGLYKDHSVREIANLLNEEGIMITKSTVNRRIKSNKDKWESNERMSAILRKL